MASKIGDLYWQVDANTSQFDKGLKDTDKSAKGMGKTFSTLAKGIVAGMGVAAVAGVAKLSKELISAASDAEETRNKFDVVYRDISDAAEAAAENLADNFGLSGTAARSLLADTGDLLTGFGFTQESALDLSDQVNQLAVDLASFTNFSGGAKGASDALTKALLGERESVKALGISILDADVKAKVLGNTQAGLTFETERQAKAYATLQIAQEQSKNAIGDFKNSINSYANQSRIAEAATQDLKEAIGVSLLPVATQAKALFAQITSELADYVEQINNYKKVTKELAESVKQGNKGAVASQEELQDTYVTLIQEITRLSAIQATGNAFQKGAATAKLKQLNEEVILVEALINSYGVKDNFDAKQKGYVQTEEARAAAISESEAAEKKRLEALWESTEGLERLEELRIAALSDDERNLEILQEEINYWAKLRGVVTGAEEVFLELARQRNELLEGEIEQQKELYDVRQTQYDADVIFRQAIADAQERNLADLEREKQAIQAVADQYTQMGQIGLSVIGDIGFALASGEDVWKAFAKSGINAIAGLIDALAQQLLAQAALGVASSFFSGGASLVGVGPALAGAAAASLAAGALRGYAGSFEQGGVIPQPPGVPATGDNMLARVNPGERIVPRDEAGQKLVIMLNLDGELLANTVINDYVNKGQILIDMTRGVR